MRPLLLILFLLSLSTHTALAVDLSLLRHRICSWETRGERLPDEAIGPGQELGRCQIKPSSARVVLPGLPLLGLLTRIVLNPESVADLILSVCAQRRVNAFSIADCYHRGPRARGKPTGRDREYAKQIASDYAADLRRKDRR